MMAKPRVFTGWHMATILVSFFLVVIVVNVYMARAAIGTFGGTVVDNSYVAGQQFDDWEKAARAQQQLGWSVNGKNGPDRHIIVSAKDATGAATGFAATAIAHHPLGQLPKQTLSFVAGKDGQLESKQALPAGRWQVRLTVTRGGQTFRQILAVQ
jgi:nitrogen fixation protein FixH